jgi:hypothetical protein
MTDQLLRDFASRAQDHVPPADFDDLVTRGDMLRRRRRTTVAAALAAVVGLIGYAVTAPDDPRADGPADDRTQVDAAPYPGGFDFPALEAGTYELRMTWRPDGPSALVTVPEGWTGWVGPLRGNGEMLYGGVLVLDVRAVADKPCTLFRERMVPVTDSRSLLAALQNLPRHRVVQQPSDDDRFGYPATHLRVRAGDRARCANDLKFQLFDAERGGLVDSTGPGSQVDLWVVDLDSGPVLVVAVAVPGTPHRILDEISSVVESIELRPGAG